MIVVSYFFHVLKWHSYRYFRRTTWDFRLRKLNSLLKYFRSYHNLCMYHFLPWMNFLWHARLLQLLTGCQSNVGGGERPMPREEKVWGGEGEFWQGWTKMEEMVKIEMKAWTWWLMTDTAEKTHTHKEEYKNLRKSMQVQQEVGFHYRI